MTTTTRYHQLQTDAYRRRIAAFGPAAAVAPYRVTVAPMRTYRPSLAVAVVVAEAAVLEGSAA